MFRNYLELFRLVEIIWIYLHKLLMSRNFDAGMTFTEFIDGDCTERFKRLRG